jgi:phosphate transport system protein
MRVHFEQRIEGLRDDVMVLGDAVERSLIQAIQVLHTHNAATASWIAENDKRIDQVRYQLEERVVAFLATQQPIVAHDLRLLAAVSAIATELERIGDYANGIAQRASQPSHQTGQLAWPESIGEMETRALHMLRISLEAFLNEDVEQARNLGALDDRVDDLRDQLQLELVKQAQENVQAIPTVIDLLEVVRILERTADRATNIGERVIYIATNQVEEINA